MDWHLMSMLHSMSVTAKGVVVMLQLFHEHGRKFRCEDGKLLDGIGKLSRAAYSDRKSLNQPISAMIFARTSASSA